MIDFLDEADRPEDGTPMQEVVGNLINRVREARLQNDEILRRLDHVWCLLLLLTCLIAFGEGLLIFMWRAHG